jgi:hypothetical protein
MLAAVRRTARRLGNDDGTLMKQEMRMLKSWKTRALATAGAVALAAPFAFMGGATAQTAPTATGVTVTSTTGNFTPGTPLTVTGAGCTPVGTVASTATVRLRGPGGTLTSPVVSSSPATVLPDGSFTGSLTIPADARVGDTFLATAFCSNGAVQGTEVAGTPVITTAAAPILSGSVAGTVSGVLSATGTSGTGLTTGGTTGTGTTGTGTTGTTTGVATPIPQQPTFTG